MDTIIVSIVNAPIGGLPDLSRTIRDLWGCWEEPNGDGGLQATKVTVIFDNNTAAGWPNAGMKSNSSTLVSVVCCSQQGDSTSVAQVPMRGGHSYLPLEYIFTPPAKDMIDEIG